MSDEDREIISIIRRGYEAFSRGDFDTAMEMMHTEVEFVLPGGFTTLRGRKAVRAWMEPEAIEDQRIEPLEFRINGKRALVRQRSRGRGAASGIELDVESWGVWTFDHQGLATRLQAFLIHEEDDALEAAGLWESDPRH